jgi:SRSO17 transposase
MLQIEPIATAPALDLTPQDIDTIIDELRAYHAIYGPLFQRREQHEWSEPYLRGLLLNIPRKSIEPMVLTLKGADRNAVRALQQFVSEGAWDDEAILQRHGQEVDADLGDAEGVLTLAGSDFPKQGTESVGVKRQYCGELGQRANCQAGVFLGYGSQQGYTLLDRRLYLPEEWVTDGTYAARRQACGVPEGLRFTTKPMLGWAMIQAVRQAGALRCRWVACDEAFGRDTTLLDNVASLGWWYFAEVPHDTRVWPVQPATAVPAEGWSCQSIKEGSQGPLVAAFAMQRVIAVRHGLPGPEIWLVLRRTPAGELKTYLCNAPADTASSQLVRISGMRWTIETCFETGKQYLGLGDYEVRSWRGWHHHMTLVILALSFMVRLQGRLKKTLRP